ncbi:Hypothetical Protein FCC1311_065042 [Hondaea fermentalgiana]|uniref:Uncharacterized protein n=1 Tax=Hondaea fermentalgiana TaxID=2315210 RepID=A0A2R5GI70_9STRA|nr:Hypothetical Protein FCC1311_065042 [Hondaea fermentalgiana]|eukprot:GBG30285.1 Hypothetical Protein FCC1311_065042 [Hondaea fermentalgiana]
MASSWTDLLGRPAEDDDAWRKAHEDPTEHESSAVENDGNVNNTAFFDLEGNMQRLKMREGKRSSLTGQGRRSSITSTRSGMYGTPQRNRSLHMLRSPGWQSQLSPSSQIEGFVDDDEMFLDGGRSKLGKKSLRKLQNKFPKPSAQLLDPPQLLLPGVIKDPIHLECEVGMAASFQVPIRNESRRRVVLRPVVRDVSAQKHLKVTPARCVIEPGAANTVMLAFCPRTDVGTNWWRVDLVEDASEWLVPIKVMATTLRSLWVAPDRPIVNVGGASLGGTASSRVELENKTDRTLQVCAFLAPVSASSAEITGTDDEWGEPACSAEDSVRAFDLRLASSLSMSVSSLASRHSRGRGDASSGGLEKKERKVGWFHLEAGETRVIEVNFSPGARLRHNAVLKVRSRQCDLVNDKGLGGDGVHDNGDDNLVVDGASFINTIQIPVMGYGGRASIACAGEDAFVDVVEVRATQEGAHKMGSFRVENRGDRTAFVRPHAPGELKHRVIVEPEWCTLEPGESAMLRFKILSSSRETMRVTALHVDWGDEILRHLRTRAKSKRGAVVDLDLNETMTSVSRLDAYDDLDALNMALAALEPEDTPVARNAALDLAHFFDEYLFEQRLRCTIVDACLESSQEESTQMPETDHVELRPAEENTRRNNVTEGGLGDGLRLGRRAIKVEPFECRLVYERSKGMWCASLGVTNVSDETVPVHVNLPGSLELSCELTQLAPKECATVEVRSRKFYERARTLYIGCRASSLDACEVFVRHASQSAGLSLEPETVLKFPATAPGAKSCALVRIRNHGDVALPLEFCTSEQFDLRSKHRQIVLQSHAHFELKIYFRPFTSVGHGVTCAGHLRVARRQKDGLSDTGLVLLLQGHTLSDWMVGASDIDNDCDATEGDAADTGFSLFLSCTTAELHWRRSKRDDALATGPEAAFGQDLGGALAQQQAGGQQHLHMLPGNHIPHSHVHHHQHHHQQAQTVSGVAQTVGHRSIHIAATRSERNGEHRGLAFEETKLQGTISRGVLGVYGIVLTAGLCLGVMVLIMTISSSLTSRRDDVVYLGSNVNDLVHDLGANEYVCPGSAALVHASCKIEADADASCLEVMDEMVARVNAQGIAWTDPHNNGSYSVVAETQTSTGRHVLVLERRTGDDKYTDLMSFVFAPTSRKTCIIRGCSESQVPSVLDYSTNYCNMHNLYCSATSSPMCPSVRHDFTTHETKVVPSYGAGTNVDACAGHRSSATLLHEEYDDPVPEIAAPIETSASAF